MYPMYQVEKGNWLVGVKGDKPLPPSPRFEHRSKGCYARVLRAAVVGKEEWVVVEEKEVLELPDDSTKP